MSPQLRPRLSPLIPPPKRPSPCRNQATTTLTQGETASRYSISEWWLEPRTRGPGAHAHADDHIFYVLAGTLNLVVDGKQTDAQRGSYVLIPGGVPHDFENHGKDECGFISITVPAGFEQMNPHSSFP